MHSISKVFLALVLALALTACGDGGSDQDTDTSTTPEPAPESVNITVDDKSIDVPSSIEAEPTMLVAENVGKNPHQVYIARINEGFNSDDVQKALNEGDFGVLEEMIMIAGSFPGEGTNFGRVSPGRTGELTIDYPEGSYMVVDPETEGPPPVGFFEITAATGPEVREPESDYEIEAGDFYFETTEPTAGPSAVKVTNAGEQDHEVSVSGEGKGEEEAAFTFAPPPGGRLWTTMDLRSGTYRLLCFFPDDKSGKQHLKLGMKSEIVVP